jgi:hypothetical protein
MDHRLIHGQCTPHCATQTETNAPMCRSSARHHCPQRNSLGTACVPVGMRGALVGSALVLALAITGCTAAPPVPQPTPTAKHASTGTLTGRVLVFGGPVTATGAPTGGRPMAGQRVSVQVSHRGVVSTTSDQDGRFTFQLPPGSFTLQCPGGPEAVTVLLGQTTSQDCPIYAL